MNYYDPWSRSAVLDFEFDDFNTDVLQKIRDSAKEYSSPPAYILAAEDVLVNAGNLDGELVAALPLCGVSSDGSDYADSDVYSEVHPRPDGKRIACLMLGHGAVALTHRAARWANLGLSDRLNVLWLFDDVPIISRYSLSGLYEDMDASDAVERDHSPLTQEEVQAWRRVAADAKHVGYFEVVDLSSKASSMRDAILFK